MKEYTVEQDGIETTVLLSDEDAEERGLSGGKKVDEYVGVDINAPVSDDDGDGGEKQADKPSTKKRSAANKSG